MISYFKSAYMSQKTQNQLQIWQILKIGLLDKYNTYVKKYITQCYEVI